MNLCIVIGRWVRDNELRFSQSGKAVLKNTIAVSRPFKKDETDYFDVTIFGKVAENTANYTGKGSLIGIEGRMQQDKWETDAGEKRTKVGIIANSVEFLGTNNNGSNDANRNNNDFGNVDIDLSEFEAMDDSEDVPF